MISGTWKMKFSEANVACMVNVHMNGDYDFWYKIVRVAGRKITLHHYRRGEFEKTIRKDKTGREYFTVMHSGEWQQLSKARPERVKCMPFLDNGGQFNGHKPEIVTREKPKPCSLHCSCHTQDGKPCCHCMKGNQP